MLNPLPSASALPPPFVKILCVPLPLPFTKPQALIAPAPVQSFTVTAGLSDYGCQTLE